MCGSYDFAPHSFRRAAARTFAITNSYGPVGATVFDLAFGTLNSWHGSTIAGWGRGNTSKQHRTTCISAQNKHVCNQHATRNI